MGQNGSSNRHQHPNQGYPRQGHPQQQAYPRQGHPQQQAYPQQGYPQQGYPQQQAYPQQGYPQQQAYPQQGYPQQQAYPRQGYPQQSAQQVAPHAGAPRQANPPPNHERAGESYMYQSNFSKTLDDMRAKIGGKLDEEMDFHDKKIGKDARTIAESLLMSILQLQQGRYGALGLVSQGSFHEGITLKSINEFNFMITLEDVGGAITEVKDASNPGFVDIKLRQGDNQINQIEDVVRILSPSQESGPPGQGAFWEDIKTVISTIILPQGWSLRTDELIKSNFFFQGPTVSILYNVDLPSVSGLVPVTIDIAVGVPIPLPHYPPQMDILQRLPYEHPLHGIMGDCIKESELYAVVKDGKMRLSFSGLEGFLIGNMPSLMKKGYLMLRAFRDTHATTVYKMGCLPRHCTSTFVLKTIFLHELFTFPQPTDWMYAKGVEPNPPHTRDLMADRLMGMIFRWSKALKSGRLPNFFVSTANALNPNEDYEDDDDFLDLQLQVSFKNSVPELVSHVERLQERIDSLQNMEAYKLPLSNNPYASTTTVVPWMFTEENFVNGKTYHHAKKSFTVSA